MSTGNTAFKVADLDFTSIKNNLKDFLKSQNTFKDYDFEGSGLGVLLDILAYNTYYNSYYMNMIANESFLDTSQLRQNILSHAKAINYFPVSNRGAQAVVNIVVTPGQEEDQDTNFIYLDKYTRFIGTNKDNINLPFYALNSNSAYKSNGSFTFANVTLKQGEVITMEYLVSANNTARKFEIPSQNVDTSTLVVRVQESIANNHTEEYTLFNDATLLRSNTRAYFVEENENLNYTIYFGDDIIGKRPANGNIVIVTYADSVGSYGNNITKFIQSSDYIGGLYRTNVSINSVYTSVGGVEKEPIEQIRKRAPYAYTAQNRAVTKSDYQNLITNSYQNIDAVNVWGGEENDPVVYGKVYLSLKTKGYYTLTMLEKDIIKNEIIQNLNVMTVTPEIVDPDYSFILVRGKVYYNPKISTKTEGQLSSGVRQAVINYAVDELNNFDSVFVLNKLDRYAEYSDPSITMVDINFLLQKRIYLQPNTTLNYTIDFGCPLSKGVGTNKLYTYPQATVYDKSNILRSVFFEEVPSSYTGISSVKMVNAGMNYTSVPTVTITGDGTGATAAANVVNGRITGIYVKNPGSEYSRATVSITGGGGTEASAEALVQAKQGILRSYYYKSNGEKIIVNPNAGTIDYSTGKIILNSLYVTGTVVNPYYDDLVLTINAVTEDDNIFPKRNQLIALDSNDAQSIQVEIVTEK